MRAKDDVNILYVKDNLLNFHLKKFLYYKVLGENHDFF